MFDAHTTRLNEPNLTTEICNYSPLSPRRLSGAKRAFTTRRADLSKAVRLRTAATSPEVGDLVFARVVRPSQHRRLELPNGRRATLHFGDEIVVAYGARYATDQFEAAVPEALGPCHLVAAGGVAGLATAKHDRMKHATEIAPVGLLADATGTVLNLRDFGLPTNTIESAKPRPHVTVVLGTAMNAGKTASVASLTRNASLAGERVGVAKATGTGAGGDLWSALDAGAVAALDFTDAGYPSSHRIGASATEAVLGTLVAELAVHGVDRIIVEIADGLLFQETVQLVRSSTFATIADQIVLAAGDGMGAIACEQQLQALGYTASALTGLFTASPLAIAEVRAQSTTPVIETAKLSASALCAQTDAT